MSDSWIILRCADRSTLRLSVSLAEDGYDVWTPVETRRVRVPRMNARQIIKTPLLKGYVFASHDQRHDLMYLSDNPARHVSFSIVRNPSNFDKPAKVLDCHLDGLRWIEARQDVTAKKADRQIPEGVTVRVGSGLFSGMTGVVRRSKRGLTLVVFNDRYSAEIPTSLLCETDAYRFQSATGGLAALAA